MAKYRGFVGQVAPLGDCPDNLGALRTSYDLNGERTAYRLPYTTNKISPPAELTEPAPVLEPVRYDWGGVVPPSEQELEARQYATGGDGTATELERTALIDEAYKRILAESGYTKDAARWEGVTGIYHPDDLASKTPISCMRTNPNIRTLLPMVCKPNQAAIDYMAAKGLKTTLPLTPEAAKPNLLPLAIGAGLIWLMS